MSALLLAVWLSVLMSGSDLHDDYSVETTLIAGFSIIALTFQLFSMFNSAIILLLINELGDDGEALYVIHAAMLPASVLVCVHLCIHTIHTYSHFPILTVIAHHTNVGALLEKLVTPLLCQ